MAGACLFAFLVVASPIQASAATGGSWSWPVVGPIVRSFDAPESPYGSGHRGIDIAATLHSTVHAAAPGVVAFAGAISGDEFVSIEHAGGLRSTYSWLTSSSVKRGDAVFAGEPIATSGPGHAGSSVPHLHFGAKRDGVYVDPLSLLTPASVPELIHLVPLGGPPMGGVIHSAASDGA